MEPRTFYYSKGIGILQLFACLLFISLICWGIFFTDTEVGKKVIVGIALPLFIYLAIAIVRSRIIPSFKKEAAFIINKKGIYFAEENVVISWGNIDRVNMTYPQETSNTNICKR